MCLARSNSHLALKMRIWAERNELRSLDKTGVRLEEQLALEILKDIPSLADIKINLDRQRRGIPTMDKFNKVFAQCPY